MTSELGFHSKEIDAFGTRADRLLPGPTSRMTKFCGKALNGIIFTMGMFTFYEGFLAPRASLPSMTKLAFQASQFLTEQKMLQFSEVIDNHASLLDETATINFKIRYGLLGAVALCAGAFFLKQCCFTKNPYNEKDRHAMFGLQAASDLARIWRSKPQSSSDLEAALSQADGLVRMHPQALNDAGELIGSTKNYKASVDSLKDFHLNQKKSS